jgi:hypothetical protein
MGSRSYLTRLGAESPYLIDSCPHLSRGLERFNNRADGEALRSYRREREAINALHQASIQDDGGTKLGTISNLTFATAR